MKRLTIILLLASFNSFAQPKITSFNFKYFILGTLSDYGGREYYSSISNRVDFYYLYEKPLSDFIDSVVKKNGIKQKMITTERRIYIKSRTFAKELNSYFDFKSNSTKILIKKNNWEKCYSGYLKEGIFDDSSKIYSFILGAYIRHGKATDSIYMIDVANSLTICETSLKLLQLIGCKEVSIKSTESLPTSVIVYFKPTKKLTELMTLWDPLLIKLREYKAAFFKARNQRS